LFEDHDIQNIELNLQIMKLNNYLVIYTSELNQHTFICTINLNSRNSTIAKFGIPPIKSLNTTKITAKYNDNNWSKFYVKIGAALYVYEQKSSFYVSNKSKLGTQMPIRSYSLLTEFDEFHFAGNMLIV
jgi:hypothetical protein